MKIVNLRDQNDVNRVMEEIEKAIDEQDDPKDSKIKVLSELDEFEMEQVLGQ